MRRGMEPREVLIAAALGVVLEVARIVDLGVLAGPAAGGASLRGIPGPPLQVLTGGLASPVVTSIAGDLLGLGLPGVIHGAPIEAGSRRTSMGFAFKPASGLAKGPAL